MKFKSEELILELIQQTKENIAKVEALQKLDLEVLQKRRNSESWNVLECLEHLNSYGVFYLAEIEKSIDASKTTAKEDFKSGVIGNYFAKSMLPREKENKMRALKDKDPIRKELDLSVVSVFLKQQSKMLQLLNKAKKVDLAKAKTAISISNVLKLRLGDTFRVVIYHTIRHVRQAEKAVK